ncbi:alpha/beta hydrolase-fold protein [Arthrobacter globiformis]|uniref:alpha/beta hydrolase n=1 Tax=Arthrobacter globiformis TaxID=1665 RepID=UPI00397918D3
MDQSSLPRPSVPRRRVLQLAAAAGLTAATSACTAPPRPVPGPTTATTTAGTMTAALPPAPPPSVQPSTVPSSVPASAAPVSAVSTRTGGFVSRFRPAVITNWSLAVPLPEQANQLLPVAVFLHGRGASSEVLLRDLAADRALQRYLDDGGAPFAVAAVDGGDSWWHARSDGTDTQSMLVQEFLPFLGEQGLDLGRVGIFGTSMGGFGALLLASRGRVSGLRAVAAMSPAVWSSYKEGMQGAFDGPADFAANDVFALRPRLAAIPKRIDCGSEDDLAATVRRYRSGLPGRVEGGFQPGGHDAVYWRSVLPDVLDFLGRSLG